MNAIKYKTNRWNNLVYISNSLKNTIQDKLIEYNVNWQLKELVETRKIEEDLVQRLEPLLLKRVPKGEGDFPSVFSHVLFWVITIWVLLFLTGVNDHYAFVKFPRPYHFLVIMNSQNALHVASNPIFIEKTKHLDIDCHVF
jgi:hypothetical protein